MFMPFLRKRESIQTNFSFCSKDKKLFPHLVHFSLIRNEPENQENLNSFILNQFYRILSKLIYSKCRSCDKANFRWYILEN
jgi:hypothetical protein